MDNGYNFRKDPAVQNNRLFFTRFRCTLLIEFCTNFLEREIAWSLMVVGALTKYILLRYLSRLELQIALWNTNPTHLFCPLSYQWYSISAVRDCIEVRTAVKSVIWQNPRMVLNLWSTNWPKFLPEKKTM